MTPVRILDRRHFSPETQRLHILGTCSLCGKRGGPQHVPYILIFAAGRPKELRCQRCYQICADDPSLDTSCSL